MTAVTLPGPLPAVADIPSMRNFTFVGLLAVVAIIGWMAKGMLAPAVSHDPNDRSTVEYWETHAADRATMLSWCQQHPQQQNSGECSLAAQAQTQADVGATGQSGSSGSSSQAQGTDQTTGQASDELQAQQDSNAMGN
jgi:hypothetical protein